MAACPTLALVRRPCPRHDRRVTTTRQTYWHPFARMADVIGNELVFERGTGVRLRDTAGREYLDATASLWCCNVGHGRRELAEAAAEQLERLSAYSTFDVYANRPALELADAVTAIAPTGPGSAAFFTTSGSEAIETAGKLVRRYWQVEGQPQRTVIVAREGAYHGMSTYGTSLAGIPANAAGWGTLIPDVLHVDAHDPAALERLLDEQGDRIAAFIGEPVIGAGGVRPPRDGYWAEVQRICRARDVLLIADEVVTGFGRCGSWFASERYGIEPDLVTGAKGITSGYLPLGVVVCGERVRAALWAERAGAVRHGYTYSGHATACAVALRNLELIELERLRERVAKLEAVLPATVGRLAAHPLVEEVRTAGLLAGVQLRAEALAADPALVDRVVVAARERGVLVRALVGTALQVSPPFVISEQELAQIADVIGAALDSVAAAI